MAKKPVRSMLNLAFMGGTYENMAPEARRHLLFLNLVIIVGIIILGVFGTSSLRENKLFLGIADLVTGGVLLAAFIFLRLSKKYLIVSYIAVISVSALFFFLLYSGGSDRSGVLWLLAYPLITIFLVGIRAGIFFTLGFLGLIGSFLFVHGLSPIDYGPSFSGRLIGSYILITAFAVFYEYVRKSTQQRLEDSMAKLETTTHNLIQRKQETDSIFANVQEGIFLLDADQCITAEYSTVLEGILEKSRLKGLRFTELMRSALPEKMVEVLQDYLDMLYAPNADLKLLSEINPIEKVEFNLPTPDGKFTTKHLVFHFSPISQDGRARQVLGTVRDVTSETNLVKELEVQEDKAKRQMQKLSQIINVEPSLMNEFIADAEEELENINTLLKSEEQNYALLLPLMYQSLHAIKGNALLLGLSALGNRLHGLEDQLNIYLTKKHVLWQDLFNFTAQLGEIQTEIEEIKSLIEKLMSFQATMQLSGLEEKNLLLTTLRRLVEKLSAELNKEAHLVLQGFHTKAISPRYRKLVKEVLIQIIRNALSHGIECPAERETAGKQRRGIISISCEKKESRLWITVRDDGVGLDVEAIRNKAKKIPEFKNVNIDELSEAQVMSLIFKPGFSTAGGVSLAAGRGMGMSLIKSRVEEKGGRLKVRTARGKFAEFSISLPT